MSDDRGKTVAEWRRAMRESDDESVSPILNSWYFRGGRSKLTYGDLGAIGGAIRKLGMIRSAFIAVGLMLWGVILAELMRVTGFPGVYGLRCYRCGFREYVYSPRLLHGGAAEIALFAVMWLPFVGFAALFIFARRRQARRRTHSKPE